MSSVLWSVYGFVSAFLFGFFTVSLVCRDLDRIYRILFGIFFGFSIVSVNYFIYLLLDINNFLYYRLGEAILLTVLAIVWFMTRRRFAKPREQEKFRVSSWFAIANVYALMIFLKYFANNPLGHWDGFHIWNIKALFMSIDTTKWLYVFRLPHFMSHNDYPLFLPANTARLWQYSGGESIWVNIIFGAIFTFAVIYLLYFAIRRFNNKYAAVGAVVVTMMCGTFLVNGAGQCADIPLAYGILVSVVLLFFFFEAKKSCYLVLGVLSAGLCGWIKNDGLMFFLIYLFVLCIYFLWKRQYKNIGITALAAIPPVVLTVVFKVVCKNPNDLVLGIFMLQTYKNLFDVHKYIFILKWIVKFLFERFASMFLLVILMLKGFEVKSARAVPFILALVMFVLMCAGYFAVYLLSPHDLGWILEFSLDRIMLQILPFAVLLIGVSLRLGKE